MPGVAAAGGGVVTGFTPISSGQLNPGDPSQFSTPALALREGRGLLSWTEAQWGAPATPGSLPLPQHLGPASISLPASPPSHTEIGEEEQQE